MPGPKRNRRERTDEWASIKQWTIWPEQELYEAIRPRVLYHETAGERAKEIDVPQCTLSRRADEFERDGMQSLFPSGERCSRRFVSSSWTYGNTDQGTVEVSWCQDAHCTARVRLRERLSQ